jgi:hypothetical protein
MLSHTAFVSLLSVGIWGAYLNADAHVNTRQCASAFSGTYLDIVPCCTSLVHLEPQDMCFLR